ncbi:MAG: sugar phosphate nucleotidyltransferase [Thermodesulfovibrionales bacterium]
MNLKIFILAAGLGERLRPITDYFPKPLLPVLGKPVIQLILEKVSDLPADKIGINLHHKKDIIEAWIKKSSFNKKIELFHEDILLGTGGALKNAEVFLKDSIFLVHNSDIVSDIDLKKLLDFHISSDNLVTLAVHDYPTFNNLIIDENGYLIDIQHKSLRIKKTMAFTGVAVYKPEFLRFIPAGTSNIVDAWLKAIAEGHRIGTLDVTGCSWTDIGTPISYARAIINELRKNGETIYIHPSIDWCRYIEFDGYVVIEEGCKLDREILLRNCILLPIDKIEVKIKRDISNPPASPLIKRGEGGLSIENCILGPGFRIDLNESEMLGFHKKAEAFLIGTGGSDRQYFRIKRDGRREILMQCSIDDPDFFRHIEYTQFFKKYSIPVPELFSVELEKKSAIFEDLGDITLYSYLKCPREEKEIEEIYKKVIDILIIMHTVVTEHVVECPLLKKRIFDYEHLRWETNYFMERFIKGIMNIKVENLSALNNEFHELAIKVDSFPKTVIHRDFQSQNIMITKNRVPRVLDYQGARIGPPAYDIVSLLWDPYYRLKDDIRERLLNYYVSKIQHSYPQFRQTLLPCRLQRHMQALGAYGFLSKVKGKRYFQKYIPEALRLLKEDVLLLKKEYPHLYNLAIKLL